jgi:RHS repeat-associated protein
MDGASRQIQTYQWGLDLTGSLQGAGGVGGLLWMNASTNGVHFCAMDGNGNVKALVNAADGTVSARYEYGPFGEMVRSDGSVARLNPFGFSTKYQDDETGLIMYPARPYNPSTGRWHSRDPIEEEGGQNFYGFVNNNPVSAVDPLGYVIQTTCPIDDYLKSIGVTGYRSNLVNGVYTYDYAGSPDAVTGAASAKLIVVRMLQTTYVFKVADLEKHVAARLTIVNNAVNANFQFGTGNRVLNANDLNNNPQAYYNQLNNGQTVLACQALSEVIFLTGNGNNTEGRRPYDGVWIPGDWGWIENKAYTQDGDWNNPVTGQNRGLQGENVFCTGDDLFWGHFMSGTHSAESESWWFIEIKGWTSNSGKHGNPVWRNYIKYPTTGLDK